MIVRVAVIAFGLIILAAIGFFVASTALQDGELNWESLKEFSFPWDRADEEADEIDIQDTDGDAQDPETTGIIPPTFDIVRVDPDVDRAVLSAALLPGSAGSLAQHNAYGR